MNKPVRRKGMMQDRLTIAERFDCTHQCAWVWLGSKCEKKKRRVTACLTATRVDYAQPAEGMAEWLLSRYGIAHADIAEWYGYHSRTLAEIIGNGRFRAKRPHRAWTMIDHYLKEHGYVSE